MSLNDIQFQIAVSVQGSEQITALNNAITGLAKNYGRLQTAGANVTAQSTKTTAGMTTVATAAATTGENMNKAAGFTGRVQQAMQKVFKPMDQVSKTARDLDENTKRTNRDFTTFSEKLNKAERDLDAIFRAGVHLKVLGSELTQAGQGLVGLGLNLANSWGDFQFMLNRAAGAADIFDTSLPIYDKLKNAIYGVEQQLKLYPAKDVAEATYFWESATGQTIKTEKDLKVTMDGVTAAMKAGALTQTDYQTIIKGGYSILQQYKKPLSDMPHILAELFVETQKTSLEFPDLIQAFKFMGPLADTLGVSFEDVAKTMGLLGDLGLRGSQAGRGFGQVLTILVRPTKQEKAALNDLFKSQLHVSDGWDKMVFKGGKFEGMQKLIQQLANATAKLTDQQKLNYLTTIFGTQNAARTFLPLVVAEQAAIKKRGDIYNDPKYNLGTAEEAFSKSFAELTQTWNAVIGSLKTTVEPILLELGRRIADALTPWIEKAEEVAKVIGEWVKNNPKIVDFAVQLGTVAAAGLLIAGVFLTAAGSLVLVFAAISLIATALVPVIALFVSIGATVAALASGILRNVGGIQQKFQQFFAAIGRVIGLFIGQGKTAGDVAIDLKDAFMSFSDRATRALGDAIQFLTDQLNKITPEQVERIKSLAKVFLQFVAVRFTVMRVLGVLQLFGKFLGPFVSLFRPLGSAAIFVAEGIAGLAGQEKTLMGFANTVVAAAKLIATTPKLLLSATGIGAVILGLFLAYQNNIAGFRDFVNGIVDWLVKTVLPAVAGAIGTILPQVIGAIQGLAKIAYDGFVVVFTGIANAVSFVAQVFTNLMDFINSTVIPILTTVGGWLATKFKPVIDAVGGAVEQAALTWNDFVAVLQQAWASIADIIDQITKAIGTFLSWFGTNSDGTTKHVAGQWQVLVDDITKIVDALAKIMYSTWSALWEFIEATVNNVVGIIVNVLSGFFTIVKGLFEVFQALLTGNWGKLWDGLKDIVGGIVQIIAGLVGGFINGIVNVFNFFAKTALGIFDALFGTDAGSIYASIQGFVQTFTDFAGDIVSGFIGGITDTIGNVGKAIVDLISDHVIAPIKKFLGIKSPSTYFYSIGINLIKGLINGIWSMGQTLANNIINFVNQFIPGPVKDALGIHSPSKIMAKIGVNVVEGLAAGIAASSQTAVKAMRDTTTSLSSAATAGLSDINNSLAMTIPSGSLTATSKNEHSINLHVDVTSSDNSVDSLKASQLADLINGPEMVRTLEHMVSVNG